MLKNVYLQTSQSNIIIMRINIFVVINQINKHKAMHVYPSYYKNNFTFFSLLYIRMSGNKINFDDKKIIITKKYLI